jgi:hypothetical protein
MEETLYLSKLNNAYEAYLQTNNPIEKRQYLYLADHWALMLALSEGRWADDNKNDAVLGIKDWKMRDPKNLSRRNKIRILKYAESNL